MVKKFYCECCGKRYSSLSDLARNPCHKNSDGKFHKLYESGRKIKYTCKYCGKGYFSLKRLTSGDCRKNPNTNYHVPAL